MKKNIILHRDNSIQTLILYDSNFGNTKKIAETIASIFGSQTVVKPVGEVTEVDMQKAKLFIAGSPINGWRPTENMGKFLRHLTPFSLGGIQATAFDTRVQTIFSGDAREKIAKVLEEAGAHIIAKPEAFFVERTEGPLKKGELERAKKWAKGIKHACDKNLTV